MKWKIALVAGVATLSFAASGITPAHAVVTGNWTLLDSFSMAQHYGCKVPAVGGTTVHSLLVGLGSEAKAGMTVYKNGKKIYSSVGESLLLDQESEEGELFVPEGSRYTLFGMLGGDDPTQYHNTQLVNVADLALC